MTQPHRLGRPRSSEQAEFQVGLVQEAVECNAVSALIGLLEEAGALVVIEEDEW